MPGIGAANTGRLAPPAGRPAAARRGRCAGRSGGRLSGRHRSQSPTGTCGESLRRDLRGDHGLRSTSRAAASRDLEARGRRRATWKRSASPSPERRPCGPCAPTNADRVAPHENLPRRRARCWFWRVRPARHPARRMQLAARLVRCASPARPRAANGRGCGAHRDRSPPAATSGARSIGDHGFRRRGEPGAESHGAAHARGLGLRFLLAGVGAHEQRHQPPQQCQQTGTPAPCPVHGSGAGRTAAQIAHDHQTGDQPVLLGRVLLDLGAQHFHRPHQPRPRLARLDHLVDLADVGGAVGIEEQLAVLARTNFGLQRRPLGLRARCQQRVGGSSTRTAPGQRPSPRSARSARRKPGRCASASLLIARYAPPIALRVTIETLGMVASQ